MKDKLILTVIWFASFVAVFLVINSYNDGIIIVDELMEHLEPVIKFYAPYLTGILVFWYLKPFRRPPNTRLENIRFYMALTTTLILNLIVVYFVSKWYLFESSVILDDINAAVKLGVLLSFLVGPANAYYFGMKTDS